MVRKRLVYSLLLVVVMLLAWVALLQIRRPLSYGDSVSGALDDSNFFDDFAFDSKSGDVINIEMKRVSGNLVPAILLYDSSGAPVAHSENRGNGSYAMLQNYRIPTETFHIHALRNAVGESGEYELTLSSAGAIKVDSLCSADAISAANQDRAVATARLEMATISSS